MTDDKNESEHCEDRAQDYCAGHMTCDELTDLLLSERAAARAQGDAQGYERGRADGNAAYQNLVDQEVGQAMDCAAHEREAYERGLADGRELPRSVDRTELNALRAQLAEACRVSRENSKRALVAESAYNTLAAAARAVREQLRFTQYGSGASAQALDAALGPAPAPEEKL